jgi:type II secretory ATPase GspE/PulE/Tfp pilus assembly ATPase PilB-like protein
VDLRISSYPTVFGENVVIRLLDHAHLHHRLDVLGLNPEALERLTAMIRQPHGMVLVTGPTGSGKTTTLYAALAQLNAVEQNIMTIEDPVEYRLPLIRQTQVNNKAGITFAVGLRSLLRQDPDIIMVGEIRDRETAEIAVHAALTGHLVLSTLHTNDATSAVARLVDMGIEPFLAASTLLGVVGQRLVRRLCASCRVPLAGGGPPLAAPRPSPPSSGGVTIEPPGSPLPVEPAVRYEPRGCRLCHQRGYQGRVGLFELFRIEAQTRTLIVQRASADALRQLALRAGMRTMRQDGLGKVAQGLTSPDEVDRVVPEDAG